MLAAIMAALSALAAIPKLIEQINALRAEISAHQKEIQAQRVEAWQREAREAKTDEERINAAQKAADILRG